MLEMLKKEITRNLIETEGFMNRSHKEGNPIMVTYFTGMKAAYERVLENIKEIENN